MVRQICNALIPFFIIRMGRLGAYFSLELFFFVALYLLNFKEYRINRQANRITSQELQNDV